MKDPMWLELSRLMDRTVDEAIATCARHGADQPTSRRVLAAVQRARKEIDRAVSPVPAKPRRVGRKAKR